MLPGTYAKIAHILYNAPRQRIYMLLQAAYFSIYRYMLYCTRYPDSAPRHSREHAWKAAWSTPGIKPGKRLNAGGFFVSETSTSPCLYKKFAYINIFINIEIFIKILVYIKVAIYKTYIKVI